MVATPAPRWHGDRFTVVVVPSGPNGARLLEGARVWNSAGLTSPAAWVRPEDVVIEPGKPPQVPCAFLGPWGEETLSLFDVLGQHRRDLVRVLACHVFSAPDTIDRALVDAAEGVLERVRYSVPAIVVAPDGRSTGTAVLGANVITGTTGLSGVPREVVAKFWDLNVITSPEDRRDPGRANTFVYESSNLYPVALTSVAAVGGLFAGVPEGPFDSLTGDASFTSGKSVVVRTTVRAILGERVVQDVARRAVASAPQTGGPSRFDTEHFTTALGTGAVEETLDWLESVDDGALSRSRATPAEQDVTRYVHIKQGLGDFLRFYVQAIAAIPLALWDIIVKRAEKVATNTLVGQTESSGIAITLRADAGRDVAHDLLATEAESIRHHADVIREAERRPVRPPTPELWHAVRSVSESLLDGSEPPQGSPAQLDGTRRVLLAGPGEVVPRPDDVFTLDASCAALVGRKTDAQRTVAACDPGTSRSMAAILTVKRAEKQREATEAEQKLIAARKKLEALAETDDEAEDTAGAQKELDKAQRLHDRLVGELALLDQESERLQSWVAARDGSLLWRMTDRVAQRAQAAQRDVADDAEAAVAPSGLAEDQLARLRRSYLKGVVGMLIVMAMAAVAVAAWGPDLITWAREWVTWPRMWHLWVLWAVLLIVWLSMLVSSWYKGILQFMRRFKRSWESRKAALERFLASNLDAGRLKSASQQLRSWADVIGWTSHTPWSTEPLPDDEDPLLPDPAWLPESLRLAEPLLDDVTRNAATDLGVEYLTSVGWRRRAYQRLVGAGLNSSDATSRTRALQAVESDSTTESGPRGRLQRALNEGAPQRSVVEEVLEEAAAELRRQRLGATSLAVHLDRIDPDEERDVSDVDFLAQALVMASPMALETWTNAAQVNGLNVRQSTLAWAAPSVCQRASFNIQARPLASPDEDRRALVDVAVRVDQTAWVEIDQLKIFAPRENHTHVQNEEGDGGTYV